MSHKRDETDRTSKVDIEDPRTKVKITRVLRLKTILVLPIRVKKNGADGPSFQKNFPPYTLCGRLHRGECYMKIGACFGYGQTSHIVKGCLKRHNNAISTQAEESPRKKPRVQGRVFAMTKQDAEASNDVMIGTLSLFSKDAKVLFDSGATHSFMSIAFACRANRNTEPLGCYLSVATPMGIEKFLLICY